MVRDSKTSDNIPGLSQLTGIPSKLNSANLHLSPMFVIPVLSNVSPSVTNMHSLQMKQANFDVAHELDEFLMVEKPLTHTKRKVNPDLDKMKPELRQLEEQYATPNIFNSYVTY